MSIFSSEILPAIIKREEVKQSRPHQFKKETRIIENYFKE